MSRGKKRLDQQAGRTAACCGSGEIQNRRGSFRRPLVDPPVARSFPRSANRQRRIYGLGLPVGARCELPASTPDARSVHAVFGSPNGESPAGGGWCTVPPVLIPGQFEHCRATYVGCWCSGDTHWLFNVFGGVRCGKGAYVESDTEDRVQSDEAAHRSGCDIACQPKIRCDKPTTYRREPACTTRCIGAKQQNIRRGSSRDVVGPLHLDSSVVPREPTYAQPGRSASFASTIDTRRAPSMPLALRGEAISRAWLSDRQQLDSRCAIGVSRGRGMCRCNHEECHCRKRGRRETCTEAGGWPTRYRAFR